MTDNPTSGDPAEGAPYTAERDAAGCECCGAGGTWTVIDRDDVALSRSYCDQEEAEFVADMMNRAYAAAASRLRNPSEEDVERVTRAICKSRSCHGSWCCEWPANMGHRHSCAVKQRYDDAARAALAAAADMLDGCPLPLPPAPSAEKRGER